MMLDTEESGLWIMITDMGEELRSGMTAQFIKDSGKMIKQMARDDSFTLTVMFMREIGLMIRLMVKVFILIQMEPSMLETGKKTNRTATELKPGQMVQNTLVLTSTERNTERENSYGLTAQDMRESSTTTTFMELESMNGLMEDSTTESG